MSNSTTTTAATTTPSVVYTLLLIDIKFVNAWHKVSSQYPYVKAIISTTDKDDEIFSHPDFPRISAVAYDSFRFSSTSLQSVVNRLPLLRWIHIWSAGIDRVLPLLKSLPKPDEILITNAKGAFSDALAEYCIAAILHFAKSIPALMQAKKDRIYKPFMMNKVEGRTLGILGYGHIGSSIARKAKYGLNMRVIAVKRRSKEESSSPSPSSRSTVSDFPSTASGSPSTVSGSPSAVPGSRSGAAGAPTAIDDVVDEIIFPDNSNPNWKLRIFRESDFVVNVLPATSATKHYCGADEFKAMKSSAVFINLGRGSTIDEKALTLCLQENRIKGAALDVFETEPLPDSSQLWGVENLLISPHNGDVTEDFFRNAMEVFLKNMAKFSLGASKPSEMETPVDLNHEY